jgi:hypothetical protein
MSYTKLLASTRARHGLLPTAVSIGLTDFFTAARSGNNQPDNQHRTGDHSRYLHIDLLESVAGFIAKEL